MPYISGELFSSHCKWNLDNRYPLRLWNESLQEGDSVFLKISDISTFLSNPPNKKVRLVIHNSDETFREEHYDSLIPYCLEIRAANCSSKRAVQIPLGFRDDLYTSHLVFDEILKEPYPKRDILCLVNFLVSTNPKERTECLEYFKNQKFTSLEGDYFTYEKSFPFDGEETMRRREDFYRLIKRSKFVVCPVGSGADTHRFYETQLFGAIPIVKTSFLDPLYTKYKSVIVKDWSEVTDEFLNSKLTELNRLVVNFVTYGDSQFENSRKRIVWEAERTGIFSRCIGYTPDDLNEMFKEKFKYLLSQRKGGGYWCWKSYLILKTFSTMKEGEWVLYADSGCTLIQERKNQVLEKIEIMENSGKLISAYQMSFPEKNWTKEDLFNYFGIVSNKEIKETGQYVGGIFLIKNCLETKLLLGRILKIMLENPQLIDDTPSIILNDSAFIEHRHDQSLFSILRKLNPEIVYVEEDSTCGGNSFIQALRIRD